VALNSFIVLNKLLTLLYHIFSVWTEFSVGRPCSLPFPRPRPVRACCPIWVEVGLSIRCRVSMLLLLQAGPVPVPGCFPVRCCILGPASPCSRCHYCCSRVHPRNPRGNHVRAIGFHDIPCPALCPYSPFVLWDCSCCCYCNSAVARVFLEAGWGMCRVFWPQVRIHWFD
jgi:hypothetical protein